MLVLLPTCDCHTASLTGGMSEELIAERLWSRVVKQPSGCWEWQGARVKGYGQITIPKTGKRTYTHRLAYELTKGPIPPGGLICHSCDNPPCCNPDHLWAGDHTSNAVDMVSKFRGWAPTGESHHNAKLTYEQVVEIRSRYIRGIPSRLGTGRSSTELADEFGICNTYVRMLAKRWWREAA